MLAIAFATIVQLTRAHLVLALALALLPSSCVHAPFFGAADRDGDGLGDDADKCPDDPEDFDGFEDQDGCPEPDNDRDGILDVHDKCPNQPETRNGYQDDDGCPD